MFISSTVPGGISTKHNSSDFSMKKITDDLRAAKNALEAIKMRKASDKSVDRAASSAQVSQGQSFGLADRKFYRSIIVVLVSFLRTILGLVCFYSFVVQIGSQDFVLANRPIFQCFVSVNEIIGPSFVSGLTDFVSYHRSRKLPYAKLLRVNMIEYLIN